MATAHEADALSTRRRRSERVTVLTLAAGYAGYYLCRSNMSVVAPLLLDSIEGLDKGTMGMIASAGTLCYAAGKVFNGVLCDFAGGRRLFLLGMAGSIAATIWFGLGAGVATFLLAWAANRLAQSMGWGALVKIVANWFSYRRYGRVMGVLSLSFLFGDALARLFLGSLLEAGIEWRGVYFAAAAGLALMAVVSFFAVRERPDHDLTPGTVRVNPRNVYGSIGAEARPESLRTLLRPLVSSRTFWLVALLSLSLTMLRETFAFWTPTYLVEVTGVDAAAAGRYSLLFPFVGGLSVLAAGYLSDRMDGRRGGVMVAALGPLVLLLAMMALYRAGTGLVVPLVLVSGAAFLLIGPYSFLAGAISLDLGGKQGSATAAGLIDSVGYLGGMVAGWGVGAVAQHFGWRAVFLGLTIVALVSLGLAATYWLRHERKGTEVERHAVEPTA